MSHNYILKLITIIITRKQYDNNTKDTIIQLKHNKNIIRKNKNKSFTFNINLKITFANNK